MYVLKGGEPGPEPGLRTGGPASEVRAFVLEFAEGGVRGLDDELERFLLEVSHGPTTWSGNPTHSESNLRLSA